MMACSMACAAWQRRELVFQSRANSRHCFSFSGDRSLQSVWSCAEMHSHAMHSVERSFGQAACAFVRANGVMMSPMP